MNASKNLLLARAAFLLTNFVLAGSALASTNCNLAHPPRSAAADAAHGTYVFIYPKAVASAYSGCQTMWDERGNARIIISFHKGQVAGYIERDYSEDNNLISEKKCKYENKGISSTDPECPSSESLKNGFLVVPGLSEELAVPIEKDPRRHDRIR